MLSFRLESITLRLSTRFILPLLLLVSAVSFLIWSPSLFSYTSTSSLLLRFDQKPSSYQFSSYPPGISSLAEEIRRATAEHEKLFLPTTLPSGYSGLEGDCDVSNAQRSKPLFAVGVLSSGAPQARFRRDAFRMFWNRWPETERERVVLRFFLALRDSQAEMELLEEEASEYGDIIVVGHRDDYNNITMKSIAVYAWGGDFCGADYVVKTDDDTFIHLPKIRQNLTMYPPFNIYAGRYITAYKPIRKRPNSKWMMTRDEYPFDKNAGYIVGGLVAMSNNLARRVGSIRKIPNYNWHVWEDVATGDAVAPMQPNIVQLPVSFGRLRLCKDEAYAHFDVTPEILEKLQDNALTGKPLCEDVRPPLDETVATGAVVVEKGDVVPS